MGYRLNKLASHLQNLVKNVMTNGQISHEEWIYYLKTYFDVHDINSKINIMKYSRYYILNEINLLDTDVTEHFEEIFRYGELGITRALNLMKKEDYETGELYLITNVKEGLKLFLRRMGE